MGSTVIRYFHYEHLPEGKMREVSQLYCELAMIMEQMLPDGPEKSAGQRKLLEAKDCAVRSVIPDAITEGETNV